MSTVIASCAHLFLGGYELTTSFHTLGVNYGSEMQDCTTFGQVTRIYTGGLKTASITGTAYFDAQSSSVEPVLFGNVGVSNTPVTVFLDGITAESTSKTGYSLDGAQANLNAAGQVGQLIPLQTEIQAGSNFVKSVVLDNFLSTAASTDDLTGSAVNLVHCSTAEKMYAGWHITGMTTCSSLSALIQAASSSGFASSNNRISLTALTAKGAQFASPVAASALSTDQPFIRSVVSITTATSTGANATGFVWVAIQ